MTPPLLPIGATPCAFDINLGLVEFEAAIASEPVEVAAVFDPQGRLVLRPRIGNTDAVIFHPSETALLSNATVTHNHPDGSGFSDADAVFAPENDVAEMRIVLPAGVVHTLRRPVVGWPAPDAMAEAALHPLDALWSEVGRRKAQGEPIMNERERWGFVLHRQRDAFGLIGMEMRRTSVWR